MALCIDHSASRIIIAYVKTSLVFFTMNTAPIRPSFYAFGAYNMQNSKSRHNPSGLHTKRRWEKSAQQKCFKHLKQINKLSAFICVSAKQTSLLPSSLGLFPALFLLMLAGSRKTWEWGKSWWVYVSVFCWRKGTPHRHTLPTEPRAEVREQPSQTCLFL